MASERALLLAAYRRIVRAAERGRGVRLSADEVIAMAGDTAIQQVVWTAQEEADDGE